MTIDEAIKLLDTMSAGWPMTNIDEYEKAIKLGTEALKHYQQERQRWGATQTMWLPGETAK